MLNTFRKKRNTEENNQQIKKWEFFNLTGDIIDIGNNDRSHIFDYNTEIEHLFNETEQNNFFTFNSSNRWIKEGKDSEEIGYFLDTAWEPITPISMLFLRKTIFVN